MNCQRSVRFIQPQLGLLDSSSCVLVMSPLGQVMYYSNSSKPEEGGGEEGRDGSAGGVPNTRLDLNE